MLDFRNISAFRTRYKNKKQVYRDNPAVNEHFIGSQHDDISGFFLLFHGDKEAIENFLRSNFQMAEDAQAVYEFIQNAADCQSTHFWLFFDDNFFLAINNGEAFTEESIQSILNIGQSHGKNGGDTIGRYGVGFKLVHRLVGRTDGLDEIVKENKGPLLFSWSRPEDFQKFIQTDLPYLGQSSETPAAPWLLKILLTCFPAQLEEEVRGLDYQLFKPFRQQEVEECRAFTSQHLDSCDLTELNRGSLFFLRLGEGKSDTLRREALDMANGTGVSFRFLKKLKKITLNGEKIANSNLQWLPPAIFHPGSSEFTALEITDDKTKDWPAIIEVGFLPFRNAGDQLRRAPNFYKFFPLGDEVNGLNFVVHCNVFAHETNRRKLHDQSTNHRILKATSAHIIKIASEANDECYLEIFANVLLSEPSDGSGKNWQIPHLYDSLLTFFNSYCPAENEIGNCVRVPAESLIIKKTQLPLHPTDWGIERNWFYWTAYDVEAKVLIQQVKNVDKLGLKSWGLKEMLLNGTPERIKTWLLAQWQQKNGATVHEILFQEIAKISSDDWCTNDWLLFHRVAKLPLFLFTDGQYYSPHEIATSPDLLILRSETTFTIAPILEKLGFTVSMAPLDEKCDFDRHTAQYIGIKDPKKHLDKIVSKLNERVATRSLDLTLVERHDLFLSISKIDSDVKTLRNLVLFYNKKGEMHALRNMLPSGKGGVHFANYEVDVKNAFVIQQGVDAYLCAEKEVFHNIIQEFWLEIASEQGSEQITSFLKKIKDYYEHDEQKNNRTLSNQQIIFLDEILGWHLPGSVFFHQKISDLTPDTYRSADIATRALIGQSLPRPEWVRILTEPPFSVKNTSIQSFSQGISATTLDIAETRSFIELMQEYGEDFFGLFFVSEENGMVRIMPRGNSEAIQFYSSNEDLVQFIEDTLPELLRLPDSLASYKNTSQYIRTGGELEEVLIKSLDLEDELEQNTFRLASLLSTKHAAELFLQKMSMFTLPERETYSLDDIDLTWLNLAFKFFEGKALTGWRQKILVKPIQGSEYKLENAPASDTFLMDGHRLHLSRLFPGNQQQEANASSQSILKKLKKAGFPKEDLITLFGAEEHTPDDELLVEYLGRLPEKLENATQVAFYMLYYIRNGAPIQDKKVQALDCEWHSVISDWTLTSRSFINSAYLFAEAYKGLDKILKINKDNPAFKLDEDTSLIFDFYWNDEEFVWFGGTEELTPENSLSALEYIFDLWNSCPQHRFSSLDIGQFAKTLGFTPSNAVWPSDFAIEQEILPENVQQWVGFDQKRQDFLTALGVHTLDSDLVKLRRYFTQQTVEFDKNDLRRKFELNNSHHNALLLNTLKFLRHQTFSDEKQLDMLCNVFDLLPVPKQFEDFPLLYVHSVNTIDEFVYFLTDAVLEDAGFDENALISMRGIGISNLNLFELFRQKDFLLFDKRFYPKCWHDVPTNSIEISDLKPDWVTISQASLEWDAPYYKAWKNSNCPAVYLHDGSMSEFVFCKPIDDIPIKTLYVTNYLEVDNIIYLNNKKDPIELLFNSISTGLMSSTDLQNLIAKKNQIETVVQSSNNNSTIWNDDYDPKEQTPNWLNLESQQQKEVNDEAKRQAAAWLRDKGYIVPDPLEMSYYRLLNIRNKDGNPVQVHVRSARGGNLYLSPTDWSELGEPGSLLLVALPGGRISSITFDELMQSNGRINLQFDAQTFTPEGLVLFAKLFHFVPNVKFVIQAPNFSASEYIRSFGLHERINEIVIPAPTNLID